MEERLNDAVDRISELPDSLLQEIQSFLSIKQVMQLSLLSKRWKDVCSKCWILEFDKTFFDEEDQWSIVDMDEKNPKTLEKINELFDVVERLLLSLHGQGFRVKKFKLEMPFVIQNWAHRTDQWIGYAIDSNVEDLNLDFGDWYGIRDDRPPYNLPNTVFVAKSIVSLSLRSCRLRSPCIKTHLCSLKKLYLDYIHADDHLIQNLIAGCGNVEDLTIRHCYGLRNLHIFGLVKLKKLELQLNTDLQVVKIEGLNNLYSAVLNGRYPGGIHIVHCKNIKILRILYAPITTKWLQDNLAKLPVVENLLLCYCSKLEYVNISSYHLHTLIIQRCESLVRLELDTPNLREFDYKRSDLIKFSLNASALSSVGLFFRTENLCYEKQYEILAKFNHCSKAVHLTSCDRGKNLIFPREFRQARLPPLRDLKKLECRLYSVPSGPPIEELIDGLLWISPHSETILIQSGGKKYIFKFSYDESIDEGERFRCCKSYPLMCWGNCIKDVKMEKYKNIGDTLEFERDFQLLPEDMEILEKLKGLATKI